MSSPSGAKLDSLPTIVRNIDQDAFKKNSVLAWTYLAVDTALYAILVATILTVDSWWIGLPLSLLLGMVVTGLFVIGHDCGHRSFSNSNFVNDVVGHVTMIPSLWPFHTWRLSHDIHHRYTHHIEKEIAWKPFMDERLRSTSGFYRWFYLKTRTSLWFIASIFFTFHFIVDGFCRKKSTHFKPHETIKTRNSTYFMLAAVTLMLGSLAWLSGFYGVMLVFVIPFFVFTFWLSTFTLLHHTSPDIPFMTPKDWTPEEAQLASTIHVDYPRWVEWLCHDINWHVPHHVCVGIPHYRLRLAYQSLKKTYPAVVREDVFSAKLLRRVTSTCQYAMIHNDRVLWMAETGRSGQGVEAPAADGSR